MDTKSSYTSLSAIKSATKKKTIVRQTNMIALIISERLKKYSYEKYATVANRNTIPII